MRFSVIICVVFIEFVFVFGQFPPNGPVQQGPNFNLGPQGGPNFGVGPQGPNQGQPGFGPQGNQGFGQNGQTRMLIYIMIIYHILNIIFYI